MRSHSRIGRVPAPCRCEHDCAMAEGDFIQNTPSGVSASEKEVLGEAFVGERISGGHDRDSYRRDGPEVYCGTGRGTRGRR